MPVTAPPSALTELLDLFVAEWNNAATFLNRAPLISSGRWQRARKAQEQLILSNAPDVILQEGVGTGGLTQLRGGGVFLDIWTSGDVQDGAGVAIDDAAARKLRDEMRVEVNRILMENQTLSGGEPIEPGEWLPLDDPDGSPVLYRWRLPVRFSWVNANVV